MRFQESIHLKSLKVSTQSAWSAAPMRPEVIGLFPAGVLGAELTTLSARFPLWPNEMEPVLRASHARALEFTAGRHCARTALGLLGHPPVGIPRLPANGPGWPADVAGSLSHTAGYCGAVVTWRRQFGAIGFDVERRVSVSPAILSEVASESEIAQLERESSHAAADLATVLFSAKESFYKAHHQAYGSEFDFLDVAFRILSPCTFEIAPRDRSNMAADAAKPRTGRFLIDSKHVFTAMAWQPARNAAARVAP